MDVFHYNLVTIAQYPICNADQWYAFCDFVAAVGAGEIVNNPYTPAVSAIQQNPHKLILAVTKLRNSGYALLSRVPVTQLTAPPNHFSSLISTLKIYGAQQTANAVKRAAYTFWVNIESKDVRPEAEAAEAHHRVHQERPAASPIQEQHAASVQPVRQLPDTSLSLPVTLTLSAATLAAVYLYIKAND